MTEPRNIVAFGGGRARTPPDIAQHGIKGAGVIQLDALGLPVPPGLIVTLGDRVPDGAELDELLDRIEQEVQALRASSAGLLSVRATTEIALPGMLETVLNVGMTSSRAEQCSADAASERWAWDCRRTLLQTLGASAAAIHAFYLEEEVALVKQQAGLRGAPDSALDGPMLRDAATRLEKLIAARAPWLDTNDPRAQLRSAVSAVLTSASSARVAKELARRQLSSLRIGVVIEQMVFGNRDTASGSGVSFTHDIATGAPEYLVRFSQHVQGEPDPKAPPTEIPDALSGIVASNPAISDQLRASLVTLQRSMPPGRLEFTVECGQLWFCELAPARLSPAAQVRVAVESVDASDPAQRASAVRRVDARKLDDMLHATAEPSASSAVIANGLRASPGAASGQLCFSAADALRRAARGEAVVLVRTETTPDDIAGMRVARAVLTTRGGSTSHAAVIAVQMGLPCVVGCTAVRIDTRAQLLEVGGHRLGPSDAVTVNGSTGEISIGALLLRKPEPSEWLGTLLEWADDLANLDVYANADRPEEIDVARKLGARGLGLVRTEHMFLDGDRVDTMRGVILAPNAVTRAAALAALEAQQEDDFVALLRAAGPWPVCVRLLDPPLHEFLPSDDENIGPLAASLGVAETELRRMIHRLQESNPMLGHRGCRIGITAPAIYDTQVRALLRAVIRVRAEQPIGRIEVLVPLVIDAGEARELGRRIRGAAQEHGVTIAVGAMLETPRSCLMAGEIAKHVDTLSFGTNDLTQTTLGISRDDTSMFLPSYLASGLLTADPFAHLDRSVLELMRIAVDRARAANAAIRIGICGEHAGDVASLASLIGLVDYVSCSPWRVPTARLALGQAATR
jgi:pyruvate,orthophosphate dikinase